MFRGPPHGYPGNLDVGHTGRFPRSRSEWIVVRSRLRFGAGVCVLAAGLLMGGERSPLPIPFPAVPRTAMTAGPNFQSGAVRQQPSRQNYWHSAEDASGRSEYGGSGRPPGQQSSSVTSTVGSGRQPGEQSPQRNEHGWLGPVTRPAAFRGREKPEDRAWRHGLGPHRRGAIRSPRFPIRSPRFPIGGAGY